MREEELSDLGGKLWVLGARPPLFGSLADHSGLQAPKLTANPQSRGYPCLQAPARLSTNKSAGQAAGTGRLGLPNRSGTPSPAQPRPPAGPQTQPTSSAPHSPGSTGAHVLTAVGETFGGPGPGAGLWIRARDLPTEVSLSDKQKCGAQPGDRNSRDRTQSRGAWPCLAGDTGPGHRGHHVLTETRRVCSTGKHGPQARTVTTSWPCRPARPFPRPPQWPAGRDFKRPPDGKQDLAGIWGHGATASAGVQKSRLSRPRLRVAPNCGLSPPATSRAQRFRTQQSASSGGARSHRPAHARPRCSHSCCCPSSTRFLPPAASRQALRLPWAPGQSAAEPHKPQHTQRLARGCPGATLPPVVTPQPWQRKASIVVGASHSPRSPCRPLCPLSLRCGAVGLNQARGPPPPPLSCHPQPHLTCTSPRQGLRGGAPGTGAGGVVLPERAMRGGTEVAGSGCPAGGTGALGTARLPPHLSPSHCDPGSRGDGWGPGG